MSQISEFQEEQFAIVCERMAEGETLSAICKDADTPSRTTFLRWVANDDKRKKAYQLARQAQADHYFDQIKDLAFDSSQDTIVNERGTPVCNHEWVARSRVKVDALKWIASKLDPIKFGDRMPEAIAARQMDVEAQAQIAATAPQPVRIELMGITAGDVDHDAAGNPLPHGAAALRARIAELEAELAGRQPRHEAPKLLEHDPGLPRRLDSMIAKRLVQLVRDYTVRDQRAPETVLDEVLSVCRDALSQAYGPAGELVDLGAATA